MSCTHLTFDERNLFSDIVDHDNPICASVTSSGDGAPKVRVKVKVKVRVRIFCYAALG
jgi:hypothetical protein